MMTPPHNSFYFASPANFTGTYDQLCRDVLTDGVDADTGHWQAKTDTPMTSTRELEYVTIVSEIPATAGALAAMVQPNLPWAEEHFSERVGGKPLNPPPSHENWPFAQKGNEEHTDDIGAFSHSYPERLWPKNAGPAGAMAILRREDGLSGIRYPYGDLDDAVNLLVKHPHTRQCYVPMWYPEDLYAAAVEEVRVPCSLGWHFMLRKDKLHCFYPMRSVDLLRYWKDDLYMAGRLTQWMLEQCKARTTTDDTKSPWALVEVGQITMTICSLHVFAGDLPNLKKKYPPTESRRHAHR